MMLRLLQSLALVVLITLEAAEHDARAKGHADDDGEDDAADHSEYHLFCVLLELCLSFCDLLAILPDLFGNTGPLLQHVADLVDCVSVPLCLTRHAVLEDMGRYR